MPNVKGTARGPIGLARSTCHGRRCAECDECGDVDLVFDDPECDVHLRGKEVTDILKKATLELAEACTILADAEKKFDEAKAPLSPFQAGNVVMCTRGK